jgi:hypothetical protein
MPELTTREKIAAIVEAGWPIAADSCHKLYFLQDDDRLAAAQELGYTIHPAAELPELISTSCSLVFVSRWGHNNDDFDHPFNIDQCTEDIYEAAESMVDA